MVPSSPLCVCKHGFKYCLVGIWEVGFCGAPGDLVVLAGIDTLVRGVMLSHGCRAARLCPDKPVADPPYQVPPSACLSCTLPRHVFCFPLLSLSPDTNIWVFSV